MFVIPEDLGVFSVEGLQDLRRVAAQERDSLRASATPETVTDEQLDRLEALATFITSADEEIAGRQARLDRFNATAPATDPAPEPGGDSGAEPAPEPAPAPEPTASATDPGAEPAPEPGGDDGGDPEPGNAPAPQRVGVAAMATGTGLPDAPAAAPFGEHTIVAAADIPGFSTGSELNSWEDVARAFMARTRSYGNKSRTPTQHSVAEIRREFGEEFSFTSSDSRNPDTVAQKLKHVTDESRLDGGSLIAANGWCSPSENLYTTCNQIGTDGMYSAPEVSAPRGGINHNQGIEFDSVFGNGEGFTILTEDQVISGEVKTCVEIPCPPFVDDRLKVAALCLTGSILQNRTYPEFVSEFVQGAIAVQAHNVNRQIISDVVAGSTAVDLTGSAPWATDGSAVSQTLSAVEHAIVDIKYRLRLPQSTTLEVVLPYWILAQYRADVSRRNASPTEFAAADAMLASWFAMRGARAQYVYDWQDAFADAGVGFGADSPLLTTPTSVDFLVYPAGTWVVARLDVIRLDSVYDSVNLPQNLVTQLFVEDGFAAMRMCPLSRVYTVPICPSGKTTEQGILTCPA